MIVSLYFHAFFIIERISSLPLGSSPLWVHLISDVRLHRDNTGNRDSSLCPPLSSKENDLLLHHKIILPMNALLTLASTSFSVNPRFNGKSHIFVDGFFKQLML